MHPFQSELMTLVDGNLQYDVPVSLKKKALMTMSCLVSDASLMPSYETIAKQQMSVLLKRARDLMESTGSSAGTSSTVRDGAALTGPQSSSSILAQAAARKVQAANAASRAQALSVMGTENVDNSGGSKRAKLMLQLSKVASQSKFPPSQEGAKSAQTNQPKATAVAGGEKFSLLEKLKEMDRSDGLGVVGTKKFGSKPQQQPQRVANIKCSICMEEEDPLRAPCGHVCCKACWLKQLKIRAICPVCRSGIDQSQLARIRLASSSSSS